MMLAKRHPWPVEAFGQNIHRLVGLYEAGLAQFTSEPDMAALGESIAQGRLGLSLLEEGYRQNLGELEQQKRPVVEALQQLEQEGHDWQIRIESIGRSTSIKTGDAGLLLDRLRVELYRLKQKQQLSWLGQVLTRLIGTKPVHPKLAALSAMQADQEQLKTALDDRQKQLADKFVVDRIEKRRFLDQREGKFWQQLHQWSIQDPERLVVHLAFYRQPAIEIFWRANAANAAARSQFLELALSCRVISAGEYQKWLQSTEHVRENTAKAREMLAQEIARVEGELELPMPVIVGVDTMTTRGQLTASIKHLKKDLSGENVKRLTDKIYHALSALALDLPYRDLTRLFAQDMIDRLGGNYRLRVGTLRVILNRVSYDGKQAIEIISVLNRNNPNYY